jgi:chromosome segregation ATPase
MDAEKIKQRLCSARQKQKQFQKAVKDLRPNIRGIDDDLHSLAEDLKVDDDALEPRIHELQTQLEERKADLQFVELQINFWTRRIERLIDELCAS